jgi:hypothetical protein
LNNFTKKYRGVHPRIKQGGNGPIPPNLRNATRNFQKKCWASSGASMKNTNFDPQLALFNGASMKAIT